MSEHEIGPIGHMLLEVGAGNPGATHLLEELAEAKRRLREYEGMMTRREVLEDVLSVPNRLRNLDFVEAYVSGVVVALLRVIGAETMRDAQHELALLMNAEREEAKP
jgi:hypothetical protein